MPARKSNFDELLASADARAKRRDRAGALECYRAIIAMPGIAKEPLVVECAHWAMSQLLLADNQWAEAIDHLQAAIRLNPGEASYYQELGSLYILQTQFEEAATVLQKSLELRPDHPETTHLLGWSFFMAGDRTRGMEVLEYSLKLDGTNTGTLNNLATCLAETGHYERALSYLDRALAIDPGDELLKTSRMLLVGRMEKR